MTDAAVPQPFQWTAVCSLNKTGLVSFFCPLCQLNPEACPPAILTRPTSWGDEGPYQSRAGTERKGTVGC